jgi:hypothetical protein
MRIFLLLGLLVPFTITCFLEPHREVDRTGACFSGLQEYENLLKSNAPVINVMKGFDDTIFLDSYKYQYQIKLLVSIDSGYFEYGIYKFSINLKVIDPEDTSSLTSMYSNFPSLDVVISSAGMISSAQNVFSVILTFTTDSTLYVNNTRFGYPEPDTGICKLNFSLLRSVGNSFCSSVKIGSVKTVFVRREL